MEIMRKRRLGRDFSTLRLALTIAVVTLPSGQITHANYTPTVVSVTYVNHFNLFPSGGGCPGGPLGGGCCEVKINMNFSAGATSIPGGFPLNSFYYRQSLDPANEATYLEPNSDTSGGATITVQFNKGEAASGPFDIETLWDLRVPVAPVDNVGYSAPFNFFNLSCGPGATPVTTTILLTGSLTTSLASALAKTGPDTFSMKTTAAPVDCTPSGTSFNWDGVPYSFNAGVPDADGCTATLTATVGLHTLLNVTFPNPAVGPGGPVKINIGSTPPGVGAVTAEKFDYTGDGTCECANPANFLYAVNTAGILWQGGAGKSLDSAEVTYAGGTEIPNGVNPSDDTICADYSIDQLSTASKVWIAPANKGMTARACAANDPVVFKLVVADNAGGALINITSWTDMTAGPGGTYTIPSDPEDIQHPELAAGNTPDGFTVAGVPKDQQ